MGFLAGKKILIAGLLSNRSIAYGIATAMKREGAELVPSGIGDELLASMAECEEAVVLGPVGQRGVSHSSLILPHSAGSK